MTHKIFILIPGLGCFLFVTMHPRTFSCELYISILSTDGEASAAAV